MASRKGAGKRRIGQHCLCRQRTVFQGSEPHERRQLMVVSYVTYARDRETHAKEMQCLGRTSANRDPCSALHRSRQKRPRAFPCLETVGDEPGRSWASRRGGGREGAGVRKTVGAITRSHATGAVLFRLCCRRVLAKAVPVDQACVGLYPQRRTATKLFWDHPQRLGAPA